MTTVQPHAIWALAWSSKLVSLRCRCRRTADEVSTYGRTFDTDGGTGLGTYSQFHTPYPVGSSHLWGIYPKDLVTILICRYTNWRVLNRRRPVGNKTGLCRVVKVYKLCRVKTIRIAVSTVMDDTWILLDIQEPVLLLPSLPLFLSLFWNSMKYVSCRGQSHWWEILLWISNPFSSKTAFIKSSVVFQTKLAFMQKNHTTFLWSHM